MDHSLDDFPFSEARFLFRMSPQLSTLVHGFKYRFLRWHIRFLIGYMHYRSDLLAFIRTYDGLVPVPIHPIRRRERGYNQAEVMAEELSRFTGLPVLGRSLYRRRSTQSQTKLSRQSRSKNLNEAFSCQNPEPVIGKRLLVVDDVFTTGATVAQCAALLLRSGCLSVGVFALAKVEVSGADDDFGLEMEAVSGYLA